MFDKAPETLGYGEQERELYCSKLLRGTVGGVAARRREPVQ